MTKQQPCLQAENEQLRAGYSAARLEIASLKERVQQLGQLARDVNSRRVTELEAQLEAVGAGGVYVPHPCSGQTSPSAIFSLFALCCRYRQRQNADAHAAAQNRRIRSPLLR